MALGNPSLFYQHLPEAESSQEENASLSKIEQSQNAVATNIDHGRD
jgi:hypothetical protein